MTEHQLSNITQVIFKILKMTDKKNIIGGGQSCLANWQLCPAIKLYIRAALQRF